MMCKCDPRIRTPFCGTGDCLYPIANDKGPAIRLTYSDYVLRCARFKSREENLQMCLNCLCMLAGIANEDIKELIKDNAIKIEIYRSVAISG